MTTQSPAQSSVEGTLTVSSVAWDDPRAVALRDAMSVEMHHRYAEWLQELLETPGAGAEALNDDIGAEIVAHTVIAELGGVPVGHAALIRSRAPQHLGELEIKRVVTLDSARRRGVSVALLVALEAWATAQGAPRVILGTGPKQPEAVALYRKTGYTPIESFAPEPWKSLVYCFEKVLPAG